MCANEWGLGRRTFIAGLGAIAAWPLAARAQQGERVRRVGVLTQFREGDPVVTPRIAAFTRRLGDLGWSEGRNIAIEYRWAAADPDRAAKLAAELVAARPDVLMATTGVTLAALLHATPTIPIVFTSAVDPVGTGLVESLAHPGGNATGFTLMEWSLSAKWLDLLKQISPRIAQVAVIRDPTTPSGNGEFGALQGAAPSLGVELRPVDSRDGAGIERAIAAFAQQPNRGLVVTASGTVGLYRDTIAAAVARYKLPAAYPDRSWVAQYGGLVSYGVEGLELWRLAAGYLDRVLKGEKPADLPVQAPTKYETVINLRTAKVLGLSVPPALLATADEVIE